MGHGKWGERERGQTPGRVDGEMAGLPFWKEPAREHDPRANMSRCEAATVVRTLRKRSWIQRELRMRGWTRGVRIKTDAPFDARWYRRENMRGSGSERMEQE